MPFGSDISYHPRFVNKRNISETRERNANFGSSLLLANSPMSPKIVNGSFVAVFDNGDAVSQCANVLSNLQTQSKDSPAMRRRIKGILMTGKQFSLDSHLDIVQGLPVGLPRTENRQKSESDAETQNLPDMLEEEGETDSKFDDFSPDLYKNRSLSFDQQDYTFEERKNEDLNSPLKYNSLVQGNKIEICKKCGHEISPTHESESVG